MDRKNRTIIILSLALLFLIIYIGVMKYNEMQRAVFEDGLRQGQLLEQKNVVAQLQASGVYIIPIINEKNETQLLRLGLIAQGDNKAMFK